VVLTPKIPGAGLKIGVPAIEISGMIQTL